MDIPNVYSYTATFEDGSTIEYNCNIPDDDKSLTTEGGSRFTDVLKKGEKSPLVSFVMHNEQLSFGVDLVDGHFEINGVGFYQHRPDLTPYQDFRIIYYRTVERVMSQDGTEISAQVKGYNIGWQVTYNGENIQRTMTF